MNTCVWSTCIPTGDPCTSNGDCCSGAFSIWLLLIFKNTFENIRFSTFQFSFFVLFHQGLVRAVVVTVFILGTLALLILSAARVRFSIWLLLIFKNTFENIRFSTIQFSFFVLFLRVMRQHSELAFRWNLHSTQLSLNDNNDSYLLPDFMPEIARR
jgi:hypothetical protein